MFNGNFSLTIRENNATVINQNVIPYVADRWYRCRMVYSFATQMTEVFVDDVSLGEYAFSIATINNLWLGDQVSAAGMGNPGESVADNFYLDDFHAYVY